MGYTNTIDDGLLNGEDVATYGHSYFIDDQRSLCIVRNDGT